MNKSDSGPAELNSVINPDNYRRIALRSQVIVARLLNKQLKSHLRGTTRRRNRIKTSEDNAGETLSDSGGEVPALRLELPSSEGGNN